ncbi:hypothetical protein GCM10009682_32780 [Luedemannella flava]|uniref:DUF3828 domain-containing protein n=1 Tax=Luedemannella flava TaxID=349316 RepID=A0ABN2M3M0_9ACTN
MRNAITRLGVRGTLVLVLAILVAGVVGLARLLGDAAPRREPAPDGAPPTAASTVDPTEGDDGVVTSPKPPADDPAVRTAATAFLEAWLRSDLSADAWQDGLTSLATKDLVDRLDGVDPVTVPAKRTTGAAQLIAKQSDFAQVDVPVDTGRVSLRLLRADGRWLVDGVDWERA